MACSEPPTATASTVATESPEDIEDELLSELLAKSPLGLATYLLEGLRELDHAKLDMTNGSIMKIAGAFRRANPEQKGSLITTVMQGFGELPVDLQKECINIVTHFQEELSKTAAAAEGWGEPSTAPEEEEVEELESDHESAQVNVPSANVKEAPVVQKEVQQAPSQPPPTRKTPPIVKNLATVIHASGMNQMTPTEQTRVSSALQAEVPAVAQNIMEVVPEMNEPERKRVSNLLIQTNMAPKGTHQHVENMFRPGGYADTLAEAFRLCRMAAYYGVALLIFAGIELVIMAQTGNDCATWKKWLMTDGCMSLVVVVTTSLGYYLVAPLINDARKEPKRVIERAQTKPFAEGFPGVLPATPLFCISLLLTLGGSVWVGFGMSDIMETTHCKHQLVVASAACVMVRAVFALIFLVTSARFWGQVSPLLSNQQQDQSEPLIPENTTV